MSLSGAKLVSSSHDAWPHDDYGTQPSELDSPFHWLPRRRLPVILGAYVGSVTGGSRSAILVNIPGTPAQAAYAWTAIHLPPGKAAQAIGLSVTASTLGTLIGL